MPTVNYVEPNFLLAAEERARYTSGQRQADMVPVLTLDDIEAWLKLNAQKYNAVRNVIFEDLIAQVQAWKGGRA